MIIVIDTIYTTCCSFLGHAIVKTEMLKFLDDSGLPHSCVLHFSMDGPAVKMPHALQWYASDK